MIDPIVVAEFPFLANKSFVGGGSRPITIPANCHPTFKPYAIMETVHATIAFRQEATIEGAIRVGWRAGGRYYQVTMTKSQGLSTLNAVQIGTRLFVRVLKTSQDWLVEIK